MTLVGLPIKDPINFDLLSPKDLADYVDQSYALLQKNFMERFSIRESPIYLPRLPRLPARFASPYSTLVIQPITFSTATLCH